MRKPTAKQIDKLIEQIYYKRCSGIQINIMDIGKVFKAGQNAYATTGGDLAATEAAVVGFVNAIRVDRKAVTA